MYEAPANKDSQYNPSHFELRGALTCFAPLDNVLQYMEKRELFLTAELAMLELGDAEVIKLRQAVTEMLDYFEKMNEIDVEDLEPTTHALAKHNRLREDFPGEAAETVPDGRRMVIHLPVVADAILSNSPESDDRFITIPNVL